MIIHSRTMSFFRGQGQLRFVGGRDKWLLGGTDARLVFVMAGKVALLLVAQEGRRFLDGGTIA